MYKCGWNGCEKAYGTLNHLNAHVTMQSHGQKRVPEGEYLTPFPSLPLEPSGLQQVGNFWRQRQRDVLKCAPAMS